jgi:hypothetical protein
VRQNGLAAELVVEGVEADHDRSRLGEKGSLRGKIKRAGRDEAYLARLLTLFLNAIALKVDSVWLARRLSGAISWMYRGRDSRSSAPGADDPLLEGAAA